MVYRMINRTDMPGYGHLLKLGFRTLTERLDKPASSRNHCMYGQIQEWFQGSIVGIRQTPDSVGFKSISLRPEPVGDLTFASGYYDSVRGRIESSWRIENGRFHWRITVPANTTADVYVPTTDAAKVTESGQTIDKVQGGEFLCTESTIGLKENVQYAVFRVGSGKYEFQSPFGN